jgi:hypothetical protein
LKPPFFILPNNPHALEIMVRECFGAHYLDIKTKLQVKYLTDYLKRLKVQTLVCETSYIDKHYLVDYSQYLVRSHQDFGKMCARVHFFKCTISYNDIDKALSNNHLKCFEDYAGYSVIKPLPKTFFGRTCLPPPGNAAKKTIAIEQQSNLFGKQLSVLSVPYQEQDKIVSACATASLWSLLSTVDSKHNDSPSTLTKMASVENDFRFSEPKSGLKYAQIERVIVKQGLRPIGGALEYAAQIRAYLDSDIAVLLGVSVNGRNDGDNDDGLAHAVTVTGYETNDKDEIISLLIHDDRIGPYVVFDVVNKEEEGLSKVYLECDKYLDGQTYVVNEFAVAVNHKVRIPVSVIRDTILKIEYTANVTQEHFGKLNEIQDLALVKWTTRLRNSSDLKSEWLEKCSVGLKERLMLSLPRWVWVATASIHGKESFDYVFDATGVEQSNLLLTSMPYQYDVYTAYKVLLQIALDETPLENRASDEDGVFIKALRKLAEENTSHEQELSKAFGLQRLPKKIKNNETDRKGILQQDTLIKIQFPHDITEQLVIDLKTLMANNIFLIWIMDIDGNIIIGKDTGHPTLINGHAGRIAGEVHYDSGSNEIVELRLNAKSNRYSSEHYDYNKKLYLNNAIEKLNAYLMTSGFKVSMLQKVIVQITPTGSDEKYYTVMCENSKKIVSEYYDEYKQAEAMLGKGAVDLPSPQNQLDALISFLNKPYGTATLCRTTRTASIKSLEDN